MPAAKKCCQQFTAADTGLMCPGWKGRKFMTDEEKRLFIEYLSLDTEMRNLEKSGVALYLKGERTTSDKIAKACVFDNSVEYKRSLYVDPVDGTNVINFEEDER